MLELGSFENAKSLYSTVVCIEGSGWNFRYDYLHEIEVK